MLKSKSQYIISTTDIGHGGRSKNFYGRHFF
jgi:hypothetical protein